MTAFLLDANVLSELVKIRRNPSVVTWLESAQDSYVSALTIAELRRGVERLRLRDATRARELAVWVDGIEHDTADRILPFDLEAAREWATLPMARTLPVIDSLVAATAIARGLTIATRNVKDFADAGVPVVNPFEPAG